LKYYSAYHNIATDSDIVRAYPPLLMTTSTRDDRVHPYHARAFVRRLEQARGDGKGVYYYENIEGGHGGASDNKQQAFMNVRFYSALK
jgi:prolyl oligopeptidase